MDIAEGIGILIATGRQYPIPTVAIGLVLVIFLWKKPWEFMKVALLGIMVGIGLYFVVQLGDSATSGARDKHTMATETQELLESN